MTLSEVKGCIYICILSIIIGFVFNYFHSSGIAIVGNWGETKGVISAGAKDDVVDHGIEIHDPERMKQLVTEGSAIIADVRPGSQFKAGHIPGALSWPLHEFDDVIEEIMEKAQPDSFIVLYCSSRSCSDSHTFAQQLIDIGYQNIKVFSGGFLKWQELNFEVEK